MERLVYAITKNTADNRVILQPQPLQEIPDHVWQNLAAEVAKETSLTAYPADVLAERWQQGRAAIALWHGEIVGYISIVPVLTGPVRKQLAEVAGLDPRQMPDIDVNESATGWTHPAWRQRRISLALRRQLLARFGQQNCLYVTIAVGLGAAPVVTRLGWKVASWAAVPFMSSLVGLPTTGLAHPLRVGRRLPPGMILYRGDHASINQGAPHRWHQFCHLWVSDLALAEALNRQLAQVMGQDLRRWREAYVAVLTASSDTRWRPFLFDEVFG